MIEIKGGKKEQAIRGWYNQNFDRYPVNAKMTDLWEKLKREIADLNISYGMLNGIMKDIKEESVEVEEQTQQEKLEMAAGSVVEINQLDFPNFQLLKTGNFIDTLLSDHEEGGGLYTGTVNIVVGESGVGKSTVMLDILANIKLTNPDANILYVSSEMTRNDIYFYKQKTPIIGDIPTLLMMDYIKSGNMDQVIEEVAFNGDYDVVLLDSFQDMVVKFKDVLGWKATYAETWLTNIMIDAADKMGIAVLAIQHLTKGGTYVGSTYLKHATTSMLEFRFDSEGARYLEFSKNRRGGGNINKPLYYTLEGGKIKYDQDRFQGTQVAKKIESTEMQRKLEAEETFNTLFLGMGSGKKPEFDIDDSVVEHRSGPEFEIVIPDETYQEGPF
jgi:predicted ATP-dependent serine protease